MSSNLLIQNIEAIVSRLQCISINPQGKYDLTEIILAYRQLFGSKYALDKDEEVLASDVSPLFKSFLKQNHCCWIDFIGCDSFSGFEKKQVFFSTVSMNKHDLVRRKEFLKEYNDLLNDLGSTRLPVDVFVQLFFKDLNSFKNELKGRRLKVSKDDLFNTLTAIQNTGLLISFIPGSRTRLSNDITSLDIPCLIPTPRKQKCINKSLIKSTTLDNEIIQCLSSIITGKALTPLLQGVALLNRSLHKDVHFLYFLPMIGPEGAIGLFCYGSKKELSKNQRNDISLLVHNILFPFVAAYKSAWESQQIMRESIKSAISAIMSRNMSHDLGSHYLYYTKAHLEKLANNSISNGPDIRGAARVLSYLQARMDYLATIISNDKYPNGSVNFKSQIYDELTVDDFSKRHFLKKKDIAKRTTNFLLSNLILSENFTRSSIAIKSSWPDEDYLPLLLQVKLWNGVKYDTFTGSCYNRTLIKEAKVKDALSRLDLALPGGPMSCHAFFNVLENFIRNSAKYLQDDFKSEGLIISIAIRPSLEPNKMDFIIYDNKANANKICNTNNDKTSTSVTLIDNINSQLAFLRILDEDNGIDKSSKGLKEMLFSLVWMRACDYPDQTFASIIERIHCAETGEKKLSLINKYGFTMVPVSREGVITGFDDQEANLGLLFTLPVFLPLAKIDFFNLKDEAEQVNKSLGLNADIVEFVGEDNFGAHNANKAPYLHYFTRPFISSTFDTKKYLDFMKVADVDEGECEDSRLVFIYKTILDDRFKYETGGDIDSMQVMIGGGQEQNEIFDGAEWYDVNKCIYFERHLYSQEDIRDFTDFAYADSISGGNFTITLAALFAQGINDNTHRYKSWRDKFLGLKIKESALTRITVIDERLSNNMRDGGEMKELELTLKNIRLINFIPERAEEAVVVSDLFEGNNFRDSRDMTHFLSIHLGIIEKMVKNDTIVSKFLSETLSFDERVQLFMSLLKKEFSGNGIEPFISVHSGRGNFSKELEGPLASFPFISMPAIENALSNSKYLLSQLFYNTVYIGKGKINKKKNNENYHNNH